MNFYDNLAKSWEVLVVANNTTYQYTADVFINEFLNNKDTDRNIVEWFYYKGKLIHNYKVFPGTNGTEKETMYDVVSYVMKQRYIDGICAKKSERKPIPKTGQLTGQMDLFDFLGGENQ